MVRDWPLSTYLELGALPGAVPCARMHTRQLLGEWGLAELSADAELLVSELVTNAVCAARSMGHGLPVRLWLLSDTKRLLILVRDDSPHPPVPMDADEAAEKGRGLLLVEGLSTEWGWYSLPETDGKVVWALSERPAE